MADDFRMTVTLSTLRDGDTIIGHRVALKLPGRAILPMDFGPKSGALANAYAHGIETGWNYMREHLSMNHPKTALLEARDFDADGADLRGQE